MKIPAAKMSDVDLPEQLKGWLQNHLLDVIPQAAAVIGPDYQVVFANATWQAKFGHWQGSRCYSLLKGSDRPCDRCVAMEDRIYGAVSNHTPALTIEQTVADRLGRLFHMIGHRVPVETSSGLVHYVVETCQELNDAEQIRREYQLLFDQVPCNVLIIDRQYRIVKTNARARQFLGELAGCHCYYGLKGLDQPCESCTARQTFADGQLHSGHHLWKSRSGKTAHLQVVTVPLRQIDGTFDTLMEIAVDITQTVYLEKEKLEAEKMAVVGQTVAGLAHGIKNLTTALEGGMYMLATGLEKGELERVQQGISTLDRNIQRVSNVVNTFLNFSKHRPMQIRVLEPQAIARDVMEDFTARAQKLGIALELEAAQQIAPAALDQDGIRECLTNLVGNALDACRLAARSGGRVHLRVFEENSIIFFEVEDNGDGMEDEVQQKVFTTFFTTKGLSGTGLGLLMTKKIIQEQGGNIIFISEPGKGTTFRISLPRKRLPQAQE